MQPVPGKGRHPSREQLIPEISINFNCKLERFFSKNSFHSGRVVVDDEILDEGHLLPGVFQDRGRIGRGTPEAVGSEDRRQVGGVHLGDGGRFRTSEQLKEVDQVCQHQTIELRELLHLWHR